MNHTARRRSVVRGLLIAGLPWTGAVAEPWDVLPPGDGQRETFLYCSACHSTQIIAQQGLTREGWDETLTWMVEEQGMPELDPELRKIILDYLAEQFSPERPHYKPAE